MIINSYLLVTELFKCMKKDQCQLRKNFDNKPATKREFLINPLLTKPEKLSHLGEHFMVLEEGT